MRLRWHSALLLAGLGLAVLSGVPAAQAQTVQFESCGEAGGASVAGQADESLPVVARAERAAGVPLVRYNPRLLPGLGLRARLFLFAHECARHVLGEPLDGRREHGAARRADCWALAALQAAGQVAGPADVTRLDAELALSEGDWARVTGPVRDFRFDGCRAGALRLPSAGPAAAAQQVLDRCIHACGDRLWQCQNRCTNGGCRSACEAEFGRCEAACGDR